MGVLGRVGWLDLRYGLFGGVSVPLVAFEDP